MIYDYFFLLGGKKKKDNKKEEPPTTPEKLFVSVKSYMSSNALRFGFV